MNINQNNINLLFDNYIPFVNEISNEFNYDDNIRHLLYLIVPAFIAKYSPTNEPTILNCFKNVKIYIKEHDKNVTASFSRSLINDENGYKTNKIITINPFSLSSLSKILDNIIHEFNHAVNSVNNEIVEDDKYIKIRSGIAYIKYNKDDLTILDNQDEVVLEEVLNTAQTEDILNIIKSFGDYNIENSEISNTIYTLSHEIGNNNYESDSYYVQKQICFNLINNKTFIPTVNKLRFKGNVDEIPKLFDDVMGSPNNFTKLNKLMNEIHQLLIKYDSNKMLKNKYLNRIKELVNEVNSLIREYELKCIFR